MKHNIAVIGLGYVGLPLAIEFSKKFNVIGFDISSKRIADLKTGNDITNEVPSNEISNKNLIYTSSLKDIAESDVFIVCVPTPIDINNEPDIQPIQDATKMIAKVLKKNDLVIYESTVYPGMTREICVELLEKGSKMLLNEDFFVGYSPERINPGDKTHKLKDIIKITSGSNEFAKKQVNEIYNEIIDAGTYSVSSIEIAEAAKVIENIQRDLNIALVNELSIIFKSLVWIPRK